MTAPTFLPYDNYTLSILPPPSLNPNTYAYVTDVGNGRPGQVYSDGITWAAMTFDGSKLRATIGVTDAAGRVTINFVPPFAAGIVPIVLPTAVNSTSTPYECNVVSSTNTACVVQVYRTPAAIIVVGISVQAPVVAAAAGVSVHLLAREPTQ